MSLSSLPPEIKLNPHQSAEISINQRHKNQHQSAKIGINPVRNIISNGVNQRLNKINKPLLAAAVSDIIPQDIYTRSKMGFTFPFQKWLKEVQKFKSSKTHWSRDWAKIVLNKFNL